MPFKKYATFSGRAPRAEYWWFYLATTIVSAVLSGIDKVAGDTGVASGLFTLAILIPWLAVSVRRLHDINRSGWWLLGVWIPVVLALVFMGVSAIQTGSTGGSAVFMITGLAVVGAVIALFVFAVLPGTEGDNDYGPDPYGPDNLEEVFS